MEEVNFNSINELYERVIPCLELKVKLLNDQNIETNKEVFMKFTTEKSEIIMDNCNEKINQYLKKLEEAKIENYSYAGKLKENSFQSNSAFHATFHKGDKT